MRMVLLLFLLPILCYGQRSDCIVEFDYQINDNVTIENLKFYITDFNFFSVEGESFIPANGRCMLVQLDTTRNYQFTLPDDFKLDSISFKLGTDSVLNVSGRLDGDLDPILGMYWAWNSGYINFKMEGFRLVDNGRETFEYHLGGYRSPFETVREFGYHVSKSDFQLTLNLNRLITNGLQISNTVVIPGADAHKLIGEIDFFIKVNE